MGWGKVGEGGGKGWVDGREERGWVVGVREGVGRCRVRKKGGVRIGCGVRNAVIREGKGMGRCWIG